MSEQFDNAQPSARSTSPLVDSWMDYVQQATANATSMLQTSTGGIDPQAWRRQWVATLSQTTDAYLRSPLFLQMVKMHVDSLAGAKQAANAQQDAPASDDAPLTDDVQTMHSRLRTLEQRLQAIQEAAEGKSKTDKAELPGDSRKDAANTPPETKGATPYEVVYEERMMKVLRYRSTSVRFSEPILVCFALVNRPYILDLQQERSVIQRLLERGFDVYLIDWGVPGQEEQSLWLEDYICRFLKSAVSFVCEHSGVPQISLLGYCMGDTMATMFTAVHQECVRNLILMATPIDFAGDDGLLNLWARKDYFDVDKLIDAFGNCPGEFLQFVFQLMKPVQNFAEKQLAFCERLDDAAFLDNFVAVERWANDTIPVAGETFRQYVKLLYQRNLLVSGLMCLAGAQVQLNAITCPLLLLVADKDHLVPPNSTLALKQHVSSRDVSTLSINAGHIGLAVSSKAHRQLWPKAAEWIAEHSTHC